MATHAEVAAAIKAARAVPGLLASITSRYRCSCVQKGKQCGWDTGYTLGAICPQCRVTCDLGKPNVVEPGEKTWTALTRGALVSLPLLHLVRPLRPDPFDQSGAEVPPYAPDC
ncbi:hypothetical protein [Herbidospora mongoliensis]|uniref:hypothetical protein n=1 Tax=Herbidospora mongoliensis TaxID=688067 RepID=UPI001C3F2A2E|nr:hypothetical protein [Herbidospora mongoliensis]